MSTIGDVNRKLRVAFVGAGVQANWVHYPAVASLEDVEMVAICDIDRDRLDKTADKYGIAQRYGDNVYSYRKMIEDVNPDAVYVIGQPHIMYDIWMWCLLRGVNLYIEKPMGVNLHQAQMLAYAAASNDCITQVSFQRRSSPLVTMLQERCLAKGPITQAVCRFYKWEPRPFLGARDHMMDDCVHSIDTLRSICGGNIVAVESIARRNGVPDINYISATLQFDSGACGYLVNNWTSGRRIFAVEIHAPGICVEADLEGKAYVYTDGNTTAEEYDAETVAGGDRTFVFCGIRAKHQEFIHSLRTGKPGTSCFADAVKTMEIADLILAQASVKSFS